MRHISLFICICFAAQLAVCQTFSSTVNTIIPDASDAVEFTIEVTGLPGIIDTDFGLESVCLNIMHSYDADLIIKLMAPDGTTATLCSGVGGDGDDFTNTCFNENADITIAAGYPPFTGEFQPTGDLGTINNGQDPNGTWTLIVQDPYEYDEGTLIDWSLTFGDAPSLPFVFTETNLPIVIINTDGAPIYDEPKTQAEFYIIDHGTGMLNHPTDTDYAYAGKILTELQGYTGPYYPKVNYDFDLIDDSGLEIDASLLGLPAENDFVLKAEYLDYTLIKNTLSYEMSRRMDRYAPRTRFVELVLNNEYMGIYTITEKVKRDKNRVDIAKLDMDDIAGDSLTGGYIFEMNINGDPADWTSDYDPTDGPLDVEFQMVYPKSDSIQPEQLNYIHAYTDDFEDALHSADFLDSITGYRSYISVKSFIDFMLVNEFSANYDSYGRSTYLFKDKNAQLNIGPPWDYDRAYAPWTTEGWVWEITHGYWPFPFWWERFREDPEWRNEVYCRWSDLRETTLSVDSFNAIIDSCASYLHDAAARNFDRWGELGVTDYDYEISVLKDFISARLVWMDETLADDYVEAPEITFTADNTADLQFTFTPSDLSAGSYSWDLGDGTISEEQIPVHDYAIPGTYIVTLTANYFYGCSTSYTYTIDVIESIVTGNETIYAIYPNPFSNQIFIRTVSAMEADVFIYNAVGQIVLKNKMHNTNELFIPAGNLLPGQYTVLISAGDKNYYSMLIKQE